MLLVEMEGRCAAGPAGLALGSRAAALPPAGVQAAPSPAGAAPGWAAARERWSRAGTRAPLAHRCRAAVGFPWQAGLARTCSAGKVV